MVGIFGNSLVTLELMLVHFASLLWFRLTSKTPLNLVDESSIF
jgi:hypothetical protein